MIDINDLLRATVEMASRMPHDPVWQRHVVWVKAASNASATPPLDLRRRPDGVWELPK